MTSPARGRCSYDLTLPVDLQAVQVQAWLRALSGARRSSPLVLELWASDRGIRHRLLVSAPDSDYVVSQLRALVPGSRVSPIRQGSRGGWTAAVELGLTDLNHTLHIPSPDDVAASLLASVQGLAVAEVVVVQLVITPAAPEQPPTSASARQLGTSSLFNALHTVEEPVNDELSDRRRKLNEPNFLAALRLAARADTESRAVHLLSRVQAVFSSVRSPRTRFKKKLLVSKSSTSRRIEQASGSFVYGAQLSITELTALLGWPLSSPHVAGLPRGRTRQLPAPAVVPRAGRVIGRSNFPGNERPLAISARDSCKHLHVIGPTGTGKTTLLANLAKQDMEQDYGVIVLESKGDLFRAVLDRVPRARIKDAIVLDVSDSDFPLGFNVLASGTSRSAVDELSALITGIYGDHGGIYAPMLMYYGLHALAETPGTTFIDLPAMLTPQGAEEAAWRDQVVGAVKNRDVRQFWQRYLADKRTEQDRMAMPVHNRIWQLAVRPEIRNIIGQSTSSFTFEEVLQHRKILLINLCGTRVGEQTASLVGTLLMNALYLAVRTVRTSTPSFLYLDELQDFVNLPVNAADMLAKTRSFGLGLVLAHQDLDQLSKVRGLEQAVLANARSKIVFQTSARDARVLQREFGRLVKEEDFLNLAAYEALVRVATSDGVSAPITMLADPPSTTTGVANAVRAASRVAYGRPIAQVEAEIEARRRTTADLPRKQPKLGPQRWE